MNSFSLAFRNFKNNIKTYGLHLMAMIFSVVVYYDFVVMKHNPEVLKLETASKTVAGASKSTAFVLLVFLVFFIWYSSSFFLSQRKKEIGIYAFMGVSNSQIGFIFAVEGFLTGLFAISVGLCIGVLTGKLIIMLLAKVALLNVQIDFFISAKGIVETAITFLIIFSLMSIKGYIDIKKSKLIDLFNASKKEEGLPKVSYFKGICSIIIIGIGYYISTLSNKLNFLVASLVTLILVVWGTYWLFGSFLSVLIRHLLNNKKVLYNGVNVISISNIAYRIKKNYRTLATIAILTATTVTAFGTVASLKYYVDETHDVEFPYSFSFVSDDMNIKEKVIDTINKSNHNILLYEEAKLLYVDNYNVDLRVPAKGYTLVSFSEFKRITTDLKVKNAAKIIEKAKPLKGEIAFIEKPGTIISIVDYENNIEIGNMSLKIKNVIKTPIFGNGIPKVCLVVNDEDYETLKSSYQEYHFNGIRVDNQQDSKDLAIELWKIEGLNRELFAYIRAFYSTYQPIAIIFFLGAIMSLVYVIATGSIIYFKMLSEAFMDKTKYEVLTKLGMNKKEISKAISKQVGISFVLPLIVGAVHSCFAIAVLSNILECSLIVPTIISIIAFAIIYGIFYIATTRKFLKVVC